MNIHVVREAEDCYIQQSSGTMHGFAKVYLQ